MFENIDLDVKLSKDEYNKVIDLMEVRLGELQRQARDLGIPVLIVFEGWDASGKGTLINKLILPIDPRGFTVYSIDSPTKDEEEHPFFWRFWVKTPARGRMSIFSHSWYARMMEERLRGLPNRDLHTKYYTKINSFERQLFRDGVVIIKLFLHISKKEQKKRLEKL